MCGSWVKWEGAAAGAVRCCSTWTDCDRQPVRVKLRSVSSLPSLSRLHTVPRVHSLPLSHRGGQPVPYRSTGTGTRVGSYSCTIQNSCKLQLQLCIQLLASRFTITMQITIQTCLRGFATRTGLSAAVQRRQLSRSNIRTDHGQHSMIQRSTAADTILRVGL